MADCTSRTERIKYLVELLRLSWLTLLATASGTIGALLGEPDRVATVFVAAGSVAVVLLIMAMLTIDYRIRILLRSLEDR